jgi:hypothetical protein
MSTDAIEDEEVADDSGGADLVEAPADGRNAVSVHFVGGDVAHYAFVVRQHDADWLYAERLVGSDGGLADEDIEAINADEVVRIAADRIHLFDDGVIHFGEDFVADPESLLEDSWFDADGIVL